MRPPVVLISLLILACAGAAAGYQTTGNLQPGESALVTLQVQVPPDAPLGTADVVTITATSQGNPLRSDSMTLTTRIPLHRLYLPDIEK